MSSPMRRIIDVTDAMILKILLQDSRTSFTEIAKICHISITAVIRRYNRMKRTGIIASEVMQVNPASFGYECVADIGIVTSIGKEAQVRNALSKKQNILVSAAYGEYTNMALAVLPKITDLSEMIQEISLLPSVRRVEPLIWANTSRLFHMDNLKIHPSFDSTKSTVKPREIINEDSRLELKQEQLDPTDLQITRILSLNSRMPFSEIAKQTGISTKSVIMRYKRLREGHVLTEPSVSIDVRKLGYVGMALAFIKLQSRSNLSRLHAELLQIPNLLLSCERIGNYDLSVLFVLKDLQELFNATKQIRKAFDLEKMEIHAAPPFPYWPDSIFASCVPGQSRNVKTVE